MSTPAGPHRPLQWQAIPALAALLRVLRRRQLRLVSQPELFATGPPSFAQVPPGLYACHSPRRDVLTRAR